MSLPCGAHAQKRYDKAQARPLVEDAAILEEGEEGGMVETPEPAPPKVLGGRPSNADDPKFKSWLDKMSKEATQLVNDGHIWPWHEPTEEADCPRDDGRCIAAQLDRCLQLTHDKCARWSHMAKHMAKAERTVGKEWPAGYKKVVD